MNPNLYIVLACSTVLYVACRRAMRARSARIFTSQVYELAKRIDSEIPVTQENRDRWASGIRVYAHRVALLATDIDIYWLASRLTSEPQNEIDSVPDWWEEYIDELNELILFHVARQSPFLWVLVGSALSIELTRRGIINLAGRLARTIDPPVNSEQGNGKGLQISY